MHAAFEKSSHFLPNGMPGWKASPMHCGICSFMEAQLIWSCISGSKKHFRHPERGNFRSVTPNRPSPFPTRHWPWSICLEEGQGNRGVGNSFRNILQIGPIYVCWGRTEIHFDSILAVAHFMVLHLMKVCCITCRYFGRMGMGFKY